jgi:predicted metal-binding protein
MNRSTHRITFSTFCETKGVTCQAGYQLLAKLRHAIDLAGDSVAEDFEIEGRVEMQGCDGPCIMAWRGTRDAAYLFGGVDPKEDITDLVRYARKSAELEGSDNPVPHHLMQDPAAMMILEQAGRLC